ncbi:uracil-DNA glycosylase [Roseovarius nubinhibens]|uniref:Type-4 uracil-DNA glycosylase n=2 Tax=Roseovarius nubinhibens TaxID=314263 RepID=A3SQI5_ROSNI|nr:uracil-DNA glycosylase [Roseovarius nubinhibens]EAP75394.1 uracil-DNA glycosylase [Roseovarius nubinhibens ISM]
MDSALDFHTARALLEWQVELGADEAIGDSPVDRYALEPRAPKPATPAAAPSPAEAAKLPPVAAPKTDPVAEARKSALAAQDLAGLKAAMAGYEHCELKRGARQLVFSDGHPGARVMLIGEAPGRDEDRAGKPFVGQAGQMLDRMLAAIGLDRGSDDPGQGAYITNVMPWRPPQNRDPSPEEIAMMVPFMERHVALANPDLLLLVGNISCQAGLGKRGITRLRGNWTEAYGKPALPIFHPAYLLRMPSAKREAWADLLSLKARLQGLT